MRRVGLWLLVFSGVVVWVAGCSSNPPKNVDDEDSKRTEIPVTISESDVNSKILSLTSSFEKETIEVGKSAKLSVSKEDFTLIFAETSDGDIFFSLPQFFLEDDQANLGTSQVPFKCRFITINYACTAKAMIISHPLFMPRVKTKEGKSAAKLLSRILDSYDETGSSAFAKLIRYLRSSKVLNKNVDDSTGLLEVNLSNAATEVFEDFSTEFLAMSSVHSSRTAKDNLNAHSSRTEDIDQDSYEIELDEDSTPPKLKVELANRSGGGYGVDFNFRLYKLDTGFYTNEKELIRNIFDSRSDLSPLPFLEYPTTSGTSELTTLSANSFSQNLQITQWLRRGWRWIWGKLSGNQDEPGIMSIDDDSAYLLVATSPGWGLIRRNEVDEDMAWAATFGKTIGRDGDLRKIRQQNSISLILELIAFGKNLSPKQLDGKFEAAYETTACLIEETAPIMIYQTQELNDYLESLGTCAYSIILGSQLNNKLSTEAEEYHFKLYKKQLDRFIYDLVGPQLEKESTNNLEPQALPAIAAIILMIDKYATIAGTIHRISDMFLALSPVETAVVIAGQPTYRKSAPIPRVIGITPDPVTGSNERQWLSIFGEHFVSGAVVTLRSQLNIDPFKILPDRTEFISSGQINVNVNVTTQPDTWTAQITNPDSHVSNEFTFKVVAPQESTIDISGDILGIPSGNWQTTILYPSLLFNPTTIYQLSPSAPVTKDGTFSLDVSSITPPTSDNSVSFIPINLPEGVTAIPKDVLGAEFSLIIFDDKNGDGNLDAGETFHLLEDSANTFSYSQYGKPLALQYADRDYIVTGKSETTSGTPVNWNIVASEGWGRRTFQTSNNETEVDVSYEASLAGLSLELGPSFTTGALRSLSTGKDEFLLFTP